MEHLGPALGALLLAAEVAVGTTQPNVGATGGNLTCYQCFKAPERKLCVPGQCQQGDTVCISLIILIRNRERGKRIFLSKACAPKCTNTNSKHHIIISRYTTSTIFRQCCAKSLCNQAPPAGLQAWAPPLLLPLSLGLCWPLL